MGLSYDIISEFVKVTNGNKEKPKEGTVYATIVQASDGKYVKIDGSDLLTPTDTTTDIEDGERVTVMIKDHRATVTGNVTAPSASGNRVDKVVETVTEQIGVFETVVADKVSVNELEAYKATIENLIVGKADIEDLEATNAVIENLKVKDAEIENAIIDKADIEDLEAVNAVIENLKVKDAEIENAVVENLEATKADIQILNADFAQIKTLVSGNLTSDNILSFNITADKVTMEDAFIKDAMIANVNAAKINAGRINTNSVVIGSEDGGMRISGATQQFTDKNGNVRIQIGRDASNDFTFALYGEDGQGQIINQNGITASAIADGLIVNDMVSDNAAISGGKLDISSVVTEINNDNTTTIKSNKIYLDEQNQSLEVAFKSLKTQVDTIKDIDSDLTTITDKIQSNTSKIEANKSSISTLLAEDTAIKKQVTDLEGNVVETTNTLTSKYTSLQQNLDGFKTTVNNTYATKTSVNDVKNNLSSNYSTTSAMNSAINQKVDEITASVSSTYATKNEVKTIDNNIKANYSTTEQMESAISVAKNEINLGISQIYETKTEVSNKVGDAINDIQVGGMNLAYDTNKGATGWGWGIQTNNGNTITGETINGVNCVKFTKDSTSGSGWNYVSYGRFKRDKITPSTTYVVSFEMKSSLSFNVGSVNLMNGNSSNSLLKTITAVQNKVVANSTAWNKIIFKLTTTDTLSTSTAQVIYITGIPYSANATHYIRNLKLEVGNKATQWSPAPEDITTDINTAKNDAITSANNTLNSTIANYYTKTQTDSQIKIAKDAINLGVSETYETKTNVTSKVNSAISTASSDATSKANNALNSAKSYADTKKSEAITSANNTLNSTIANYYTKSQTDSQIKVAKDSITQSVASTYETKSDVTSKINGVNSSISNLQSRMSSAESKITDTAITNVVKQNFYTKAETNDQITSKGYQTASQVQQTVNNLQLKFTQSGGYNLFSNSGFKKGTSYWGTHTHNSPTGGSIGITTSAGEWGFPDASVNCVHIRLSNQSGIEYGISQAVKTTIGKKYTISFYYAGHRLNIANLIVRNSNSSWLASKAITSFPSGGNGNANNWSKHTLTFTASATSHTVNIVIASAADNGYLWVAKPMVVEGELDLPYSPNPNEMYDGIIEMNKDGIKVSTSNGGWTDFTSAGMNVYNKSNTLSLGTRNGGLTYHNSKGYLGFTSESNISSYDVAGVTLSTANSGSYIALGTSTATDPFGGFTSTPALSIAKANLGDSTSFYRQGVNLHTSLNVNTKPINRVGTMYYGVNGTTRTYESTTGNLCLLGDNGVVLGYYQGDDVVTKFKIIEGSSASESYIDTYAHWRFHGWNLTDVANLSIKNNIKMETTATIQFNSTATYPSLIWEASNRLKLYGNDGIDFGYRKGSSNMPIFKLHEGDDTAYRIESFSHWNFNNWNLENVGILKPQRLQLPGTYGSNWIGLGTGDGNDYTTYNVKFRTHNGLAFTDNSDSATVIVQGRQGRIMGKNAYYVNCSRSLKSDIRSVISESDVATFTVKEGETLDTNISAETVCDFLDAIDVKTYVTDFKQEGATQECFDIEKGNSLTLGYIADDIAEHPIFKYVGEKTNDGLYAINSNSLTTTLIVGYQQEKRKREQLEQRLLELERLLKGDK